MPHITRLGHYPVAPKACVRYAGARPSSPPGRIVAFGSTATRLMKVFTMQVEVLRRLRHGGHQFVRVEHVHVNDGGQAVIGNLKTTDR